MLINMKSKFGSSFVSAVALGFTIFISLSLITHPTSTSLLYSLVFFASMLPLSLFYAFKAFRKKTAPSPNVDAVRIFQRSKAEILCFIICGAGFVLGGYGLTSGGIGRDNADDSWLDPKWGIYFFGAGLIVFLWMLTTGGPRLTLSPAGIQARFLRIPLIPWSAIRDVSAGRFASQNFVALHLHEPDTYLKQMPQRFRVGNAIGGKLSVPPFSLMPDMFGTTTDNLIAEIKARIAKYGTKLKETE